MNLFDRLDDLLAFDFCAGRPDDAEPTAAEVLAEIEKLLVDARRTAARVISAERRLAWELDRSRAHVERWRRRAATAAAAGCDEVSHRALLRHQHLEAFVRELELEHTAARQTRETVLDAVALLEARLDRARRESALPARI